MKTYSWSNNAPTFGFPNRALYPIANAVFDDTTLVANVVPDSTWSREELTKFANDYGPYCYSIIEHGIVPAGLFDGIEIDVPDEYVAFKAESWPSEPPSLWFRLVNWLTGANS